MVCQRKNLTCHIGVVPSHLTVSNLTIACRQITYIIFIPINLKIQVCLEMISDFEQKGTQPYSNMVMVV